jgi:chromosome segregation ATPase
MGRATITAGGEEGFYTVEVDYRALTDVEVQNEDGSFSTVTKSRLEVMIEQLRAQLDDLSTQLVLAQTDLDAAIDSDEEDELAAAVEEAIVVYEEKLAENCTAEGWDASPIKEAFDDYEAARVAYYEHLDAIASLNQELALATEDKAVAEINLPILEQLIERAESAMESAESKLESATACFNGCINLETWMSPAIEGWAGWKDPKWTGWYPGGIRPL